MTTANPKDQPDFPRILARRTTPVSRWMELVEKTVAFAPGRDPEVYHCITQAPYVGVFAITTDGRIPLVRQFRPAVEEHTWELPAGTIDGNETPEEAARREVLEEIGAAILELRYLGQFHPDTGRSQIVSHAFFARIDPSVNGIVSSEEGMSGKYVTHAELKQMIARGEFRHQIHLSLYGVVRALDIDLGAIRGDR